MDPLEVPAINLADRRTRIPRVIEGDQPDRLDFVLTRGEVHVGDKVDINYFPLCSGCLPALYRNCFWPKPP